MQILFVVKIQHWQKVQNFTYTHKFLAFSNTSTDSKLILKHSEIVNFNTLHTKLGRKKFCVTVDDMRRLDALFTLQNIH
jgi:hypothetical protein